MSDAYTSCHIHYIFSTKDRLPLILPEYRPRLWAYIGGIAREHGMCAVTVGGTDDHLHALIRIPTTLSIAKGVQVLKAVSSKWINDTYPESRRFPGKPDMGHSA